jgi:hypothetical protein
LYDRGIMRASTLRTVLLIKAIEESDRSGEVLPLAERADATRAVRRREPTRPVAEAPAAGGGGPPLRLLAARAEHLLQRLAARYPAIRHAGALLEDLAAWASPLLLLLSSVLGLALAWLDATRRVDILALPLAGLIGWNLLVYLLLLVTALRAGGAQRRRSAHPGAALLSRLSRWRAGRWVRQSSLFNAPLAEALRSFGSEWDGISRPLLLARARRLLHMAAAAVAVGLILGLYLRGIVFQYRAGWESTFLQPVAVLALARLIYGPAAALTGVALPTSTTEMAALRWDAPAGGVDAAPWIHLISASVAFYVLLPRLALVLFETLRLWRLAWHPPLPASLEAYARRVLEPQAHARAGGRIVVLPLGHEPAEAARAGLESLLKAELGEPLQLAWQTPVRYGEEDTLPAQLAALLSAEAVDGLALVVNLAATPEGENHGHAFAAARAALAAGAAQARLLVVVDESSWAARFADDATLASRLDERRALWARFAAGYGLRSCPADLARMPERPSPDHPAVKAVRAALQAAPA